MKQFLTLLLLMLSTNAFCVDFYTCVSKDVVTGKSMSNLTVWDVIMIDETAEVYSQDRDPDLPNYPNYILQRTNKMNDSDYLQFEAENLASKIIFTRLRLRGNESSILIVDSRIFLCVKD